MSTPVHPAPQSETDASRSPWSPPGSPGWVGGSPTPPSPPASPPGTGGSRGPGWGRTLTAAVLAAVLASGGTALAVTSLERDTAPAATASSGTLGSDAAPVPSPAGSDGVTWSKVASAVEPSVVSIGVQGPTGAGEGSGVVIDSSGHVLTNNHVVSGGGNGAKITVALSDGRVFDATVVGTDPETDLAVIQVQNPPQDLKPVTFGNSDQVSVGQPVMALGNPLGLSDTVTTGIVSALDRPVTTQSAGQAAGSGPAVVTNAIQTDAAVNPGNSGGALVNASGELIGINSSIASLGSANAGGQSGSIGLGFAIPANQAQWVAQSLIKNGSVEHAFLGVSLKDAEVTADGVRREAAGIAEVSSNTPAADAGLKAGDAVISVDGKPVAGADSLVAQVRERKPGTSVTLTVVGSDGASRDVQVTFGVRPGQ